MRIITRIRGGIGNQLFCYAAARRLALINNAELVVDNVTGFARDVLYNRRYMLDHFAIPVRKATPSERMEPFERYRRGLAKYINRCRPFFSRTYIEQEGVDFDERLLALKVKGTIYIEGDWQSERYFKDVEQVIRDDLRIIPPGDAQNQRMAEEICASHAVAVHVRWFDASGSKAIHNASSDYYRQAIALMDEKLKSPRYFLFSDAPEEARAKLVLPEDRVTCVSHNRGDEQACADLWLMTQCRHFITANSTFSWWGAWLGGDKKKIVVAPDLKINGMTAWGFKGLIPTEWVRV